MDTASPSPTEPLDPRTADPRELMRVLLPAARRGYVRAWELLADASTPLERRRAARAKATAIAEDHALVATALRARTLTGDDLLNARHLADELERHVAALERLATISPVGLVTATDLRPEALGCGKSYRDPTRPDAAPAAPRGGTSSGRPGERGAARAGGKGKRPGGGSTAPGQRDSARSSGPRDPKPPKDALGTSKHDSALGDDLDEATRAKLEALRNALEG